MTEEEELREAFPEEFEEQSDEPSLSGEPTLSELQNEIDILKNRLTLLDKELTEIIISNNNSQSRATDKNTEDINLTKQAIAQIVIAGGENKDG